MVTKFSFYYALDKEGNKIPPTPGLKATCPCCGTEVYAACGEKNAHHWRHKNTSKLHCDEWYEMTPWHLQWQEYFPFECREVIIQKDGIKRRADVKLGNLIIEFQHSGLSNQEVKERELFYSSSNKIIWIIDGTNNRVFDNWKYQLNLKSTQPIFIIDRESKIYFELEGYCDISIVRKIPQFPIGLVINPLYPTFIDFGDYIGCPMEFSASSIQRTVYFKKWGHKYGRGKICQPFILVHKNNFITSLYHLPIDSNNFQSIKFCNQESIDKREELIEKARQYAEEITKKLEQKKLKQKIKEPLFVKENIPENDLTYEDPPF